MGRVSRILLSIAISGTALAQDAPPEQEARAYFDRGTRAFDEQRYVEALAAFSAGYELSHKPAFLYNMAECSRLMGDRGRAYDLYRRFLEAIPDTHRRAEVERRLGELAPPQAPGVPAEPEPKARGAAPARPPAPPPVADAEPSPATERVRISLDDFDRFVELVESDPVVHQKASRLSTRSTTASILGWGGGLAGLALVGYAFGTFCNDASEECTGPVSGSLVLAGITLTITAPLVAMVIRPSPGELVSTVGAWNERHPDRPFDY